MKALTALVMVLLVGCNHAYIETKQGALVWFECEHPNADEYPWPTKAELDHALDCMINSLPGFVPTMKERVKWTLSHAHITFKCNPFPCSFWRDDELQQGMCAGLANINSYTVYWQGFIGNSALLHELLHTIIVLDTGHNDSDHKLDEYWLAVHPWNEWYRTAYVEKFGHEPELVIWDDWVMPEADLVEQSVDSAEVVLEEYEVSR